MVLVELDVVVDVNCIVKLVVVEKCTDSVEGGLSQVESHNIKMLFRG